MIRIIIGFPKEELDDHPPSFSGLESNPVLCMWMATKYSAGYQIDKAGSVGGGAPNIVPRCTYYI